MSDRIPNILSIAGSDPSGGAGLQADLKSFAALGCYGMAVPCALTAQNTCGVRDVHAVPPDFIEAQLSAVFEDVCVDAVKIGMLGSVEAVRVVAKVLQLYQPRHIVLDPVMVATSGDALASAAVVAEMVERLFPIVHIITPNGPEAEALLGREVEDIEAAASALLDLGVAHIVLKGGHLNKGRGVVCDVWAYDGGVQVFEVPRIDVQTLHGTGCTMSSALTCYLALGFAMNEAVAAAQNFVRSGILARQDIGQGAQPLNHGFNIRVPRPVQDNVGEFEGVSQYFAPLSMDGLVNDGAVLDVPEGMDLVVSTDTLNEGVHFMMGATPEEIAVKAMRVNLSDLASMGAQPLAYQLSLAIAQGGYKASWYKAFVAALHAEQDRFGILLSGGDTTSHLGKGLCVSLTVFGLVPKGKALLRSGARVGDVVCVTGTVGDAALGLDVLRGVMVHDAAEYFISRYTHPEPRLSVGKVICEYAHACVDISDGMLADIVHIAQASKVKVVIDLEAVPLSPAARLAGLDPVRALGAGDDYELAFTVSPEDVELVRDVVRGLGVDLSVVGRCEEGDGVVVCDKAGHVVDVVNVGWRHF